LTDAVNETHYHNSVVERKEKVEAALARLQSLKYQVTELRVQCEALKKLQSEKQKEALICNECGKLIKQSQEVTLKDLFGKVKSHYHKDCFKAIWLSQTWIFDYSYPRFLRMSEKNQEKLL
jgi:hypothetical protein